MDSQGNDIILSICIPTLGGSDRLEESLQRIFSYQGNDIEVIISDNDNTGKIDIFLKSVSNDNRLHYYSNEKNRGAFYNWIKVLTYGKGKYLLTLNDIDWIVDENIPEIIHFLEQEKSSVIVGYPRHNGKIAYSHGSKNGFSCTGEETHPSCYMFKRDSFQAIHNVFQLEKIMRKFKAYSHCILALACCKDDIVCVNRRISIIEMPDADYYIAHQSRTISEVNSEGDFYAPAGSLRMLKAYIVVCERIYPKKQVKKMIPYLYKAQLKRATIEYKYNSASKVMHLRYGLPLRTDINVNVERKLFYHKVREMLKNTKYGNSISILVGMWLVTIMNKCDIDRKFTVDKINELLRYCLKRYAWVRMVQKCWRKIRYRDK